MSEKPHFQETKAHCRKCGKDVVIHLPMKVEVDVFGAHARALRCPECGASSKHLSI